MSNHDIDIAEIKMQIGRLVSDAESEKMVRRDRNNVIDQRLKDLEDYKIRIDTTVNNAIFMFKILAALNLGAIILFVIKFLTQ